jgi:hypothetical protein
VPQTKNKIRIMLWRGLACSVAVAAEMGACRRGGSADYCKHYLYQEVVYESCTYRKSEVYFRHPKKNLRNKEIRCDGTQFKNINRVAAATPQFGNMNRINHITRIPDRCDGTQFKNINRVAAATVATVRKSRI